MLSPKNTKKGPAKSAPQLNEIDADRMDESLLTSIAADQRRILERGAKR